MLENGVLVPFAEPAAPRGDRQAYTVSSPIQLGDEEKVAAGPAPELGAHSSAVLRDVLGYGAERIRALRESGVVTGD